MTEPTDAELIAELEAAGVVFMAFRGGLSGTKELWTTSGSQDAKKIAAGMRAAIAKWGTPPAVAGEPVAYLHDDGYWTAAKTDAGRNLNDRLLFAGSPKVAVYTTPQPTQALPDAPLSVFSKGPWTFKETGQNFSGAELDEAAFVAYHDRASREQVPAGAGESAYDPCGGCGEDDPKKCCLGCMHPFTPASQADSMLEGAVLLKEARDALWQPANVALCERIDAYLDAARKCWPLSALRICN